MPETVYQNFLKNGYAVENGDASLVITAASCYRMKEQTLALVENLPSEGDRGRFIRDMEQMGIEKAGLIFDRLVAIGALRIKKRKSLRDVAAALLMPRFGLIPARWQEEAFKALRLAPCPGRLGRRFRPVFVTALSGILISLAVSYTGIYPVLAGVSSGEPKTLYMLLLVLLGSVLHELGHSYAAAAAGIGFRPIGLSIYLFFPVFYTNVSGMERLTFKEKGAIDMGGFFTQSIYLTVLLVMWSVTRSRLLLEAVRWISLIIVFNMNPLLKTDCYWLYKDFRKGFPEKKLADWLHYLYLAAFLGFTLYLFRYLYQQVGYVYGLIAAVWAEPSVLLSGGYKIVLGFYVIVMFFMGGARRLEETRQEWLELKRRKPAVLKGAVKPSRDPQMPLHSG